MEKLILFPLQDRRFLFDDLFLYKVVNGYIRIKISPFSQFYSDSDWYSLKGRDDCVLKKNFARTVIFKFSFFNGIVDMWNALPLSTCCSPSICSFKKGVVLASRHLSNISGDIYMSIITLLFYLHNSLFFLFS